MLLVKKKKGYLKPLQTCVPETPIVKTTVLTFKGMDFYLGSTPLIGAEHEKVTESNLSLLTLEFPVLMFLHLAPNRYSLFLVSCLSFCLQKNVLGDPAVELS